ncbi:MAG: hypothetical protein ACRD2D_04205 [Terriglobales bacterium]
MAKTNTICLHHRHANAVGDVETHNDCADEAGLESALDRANAMLANPQCRNFGCRIELNGQVILYTLVRPNCTNPGPVRFCHHDAQALAQERNHSLGFETTWRVSRDLQTLSRPAAARARAAH